MSSTYSTSLRIQLIDTATEDEAWGQPTDNNLGTVIEQAITGIESISLTNLTTVTLSTANAAPDQARNAVLVFTGSPTGNCNVIAPSVQKLYVINNQTTGGYNVNIKTSSGNAAVINANASQLVFCDGTTFYAGIALARVQGDLTVTGNIKLGGLLSANNGSLVMKANANVVNMGYNNGAMIVPVGSTAQRPSVGVTGMSRWNTNTLSYEVYNGFQWVAIPLTFYSVNLLAVGGGGGGSGWGYGGGGGGGGGMLTGTTTLTSGTTYTVTVGAGGIGGDAAISGSNSTFNSLIAVGGGAGGYGGTGGSGGSGGGASGVDNSTSTGGTGTSGQGNNGGAGGGTVFAGGAGGSAGGGGGGASTSGSGGSYVGGDPGGHGNGGSGGNGLASSISGASVTYAGGGGGAGAGGPSLNYGGSGGTGGGGAGGRGNSDAGGAVAGTAGTANTGGGGGGGTTSNGAAGGAGIIIISYSGSQRGIGGTVTTSGGYTIHTFTSSSTYIA
jgi:hypothetical protein